MQQDIVTLNLADNLYMFICSEIETLYSGDNSQTCTCQSVEYPFMRRADWAAFSVHPSLYDKYCYAGKNYL